MNTEKAKEMLKELSKIGAFQLDDGTPGYVPLKMVMFNVDMVLSPDGKTERLNSKIILQREGE